MLLLAVSTEVKRGHSLKGTVGKGLKKDLNIFIFDIVDVRSYRLNGLALVSEL